MLIVEIALGIALGLWLFSKYLERAAAKRAKELQRAAMTPEERWAEHQQQQAQQERQKQAMAEWHRQQAERDEQVRQAWKPIDHYVAVTGAIALCGLLVWAAVAIWQAFGSDPKARWSVLLPLVGVLWVVRKILKSPLR